MAESIASSTSTQGREAGAGHIVLRAASPGVSPDSVVVARVAMAARISAAVALALFIAFALQLDNPSWAGTSAGIVCQPILGASLRKGFFRAVGTVATGRRRRDPSGPHRHPAGQGRRPTAPRRLRRNGTMTMRTTPSKSLRTMLDEASGRGPVALRVGAALEGPDVPGRGHYPDFPIGLLGRHAGPCFAEALRMAVTSRSWRTQATLDQSYPVGGTSWSDCRPRASWSGRPSPWYSPQVAALERELESTRLELRQALRALSTGATSDVEAAQERDGRSRTVQRDRAEATEDARTTCRDQAATDVRRHVDAVAFSEGTSAPTVPTILQAARRRVPTTLGEGLEPLRRAEEHVGPTDGEGLPLDGAPARLPTRIVFVVVDGDVMDAVLDILRAADLEAVGCASGEAFLRTGRHGSEACLLTGACVAGVGGLDLVDRLRAEGSLMPAVVITGRGDVPMAVRAMRAGVSDVIEEPVGPETLLTCVGRALERAGDAERILGLRGDAARHVAGLTPRQREVMASVLAGHPSKNIAADLGISRRTVENHRASIMRKMGTRSLPALARLALAAEPMG